MSNPLYQVGFEGFNYPDTQITVTLKAGITAADIGAPMAVDTSAANTFKIAGDGDTIVGRLLTVEDRVNEGTLIGTVAFRFTARMKVASTATVAVGTTVVGAGSGEVKEAAANDHNANFVAEIVDTDYAVVVKL